MAEFKAKYKVITCREKPFCEHGPTVLFEQLSNSKKFYACSAYRDRKGCQFYMELDQFKKPNKRSIKAKGPQVVCNNKRLQRILQTPSAKRRFCIPCTKLLLPEDEQQHKTHSVLKGVPLASIREPLKKLLSSKTLNKHEAQYRFSRSTMKFLVDMLLDRSLNRVICLGTPSLHGCLQSKRLLGQDVDSIQLDIDSRLAQFSIASRFVWFNMFNAFFFEGEVGQRKLLNFIVKSNGENLAIIIDPPFGGLIELLAQTINSFTQLISKTHPGCSVPLFLVMPVFFKKPIQDHLPLLKVSDYIVRYINHSKFSKSSSPVRIYTNLALEKFILPDDEYRFCSNCRRSVPKEVTHCHRCKNCISYNGKVASHCNPCGRCVNSNWKHCQTCSRCYPATHSHDKNQSKDLQKSHLTKKK